MNVADNAVNVASESGPLLGVADAEVAQRLAREVARLAKTERVAVVASLAQLHQLAARCAPEAMLVDCDLIGEAPLAESLWPLTAISPVILIGPPERQAEAARLVAGGDVEFVCREGDYIPLAASLLERRLRWAVLSQSLFGPLPDDFPSDLGTIFRHEINNPLTGILGNAELLLAHRERLSAGDVQRLQTVVDLAVRLRETVRRLSNAWEGRHRLLKSV